MNLLFDVAVLVGLGGVTYGCYQLHPIVAWLVGGAALVAFGVLGAVKAKSMSQEKDKP